MCTALKKRRSEAGFTIFEIALVLIVIGAIGAPAVTLLHQYRVEKDFRKTEEAVELAVHKLGVFRQLYGRYACPASITAASGDMDYGLENEDCVDDVIGAPGTCSGGVCFYDSAIPGELVIAGSLPFKNMGLMETESYDRYLSRLLYAVTVDLTDQDTFDPSGGRISIISKSGDSIINPPNSAHFIVASHGPNKFGGVGKSGTPNAELCGSAPLDEQENCDGDSTFVSGETSNTFDDRLGFFSGVMPAEWQISELNRDNIHLKIEGNVSIGANSTTNLEGAEQLTVRYFGGTTGSIKVDKKLFPDLTPDPATGKFLVTDLCEGDAVTPGVDCFKPKLIAGQLALDGGTGLLYEDPANPGSGISCYSPGGDEGYLIEVRDGQRFCSTEIYISCPDDASGDPTFITGIDANGDVTCSGSPGVSCDPAIFPKTCGGTASIASTYNGGFQVDYSGECRNLSNYNWANELAGMTTLSEVQTHVSGINALPRSIVDCGPTANQAQVRDAWQCNSGTWSQLPPHQRRWYGSVFPSDPTIGGNWLASNTYTGTDPANNNPDHDCWCREDYRAVTASCPASGVGTRISIQKHRCPQTSHDWQTVYNFDDLCTCAPTTTQENQSCNSYYDQVNGVTGTSGLTGNVVLTYDWICVGGTLEKQFPPTNINTSACACSEPSPNIDRDYCQTGLTNNWASSYSPPNEVGVELVTTENILECASPPTYSNGIIDPPVPQPDVIEGPVACTCDSNLTDYENIPCSPPLTGPGQLWEKEWDCALNPPNGAWEPQSEWELINNECYPCAWQGNGTPNPSSITLGPQVGSDCACGTTPSEFCWDNGGGGILVWTNCQCTPQLP